MGRWTIRPLALAALLGVLVVVVLVLVVPDVDLPDAAFHSGNAPVVMHARSIPIPGFLTAATTIHFSFSTRISGHSWADITLSARVPVDSLSILHHALRG